MNSQMTLLALGAKCGRPSGGVQPSSDATPSRWSIAPRARPVKPMPRSARNVAAMRSWTNEAAVLCVDDIGTPAHRIVTKSLWLSSAWTRLALVHGRFAAPVRSLEAGPSQSRSSASRHGLPVQACGGLDPSTIGTPPPTNCSSVAPEWRSRSRSAIVVSHRCQAAGCSPGPGPAGGRCFRCGGSIRARWRRRKCDRNYCARCANGRSTGSPPDAAVLPIDRDRRTAEPQVELAAQKQQAVADDLGLHPGRVLVASRKRFSGSLARFRVD